MECHHISVDLVVRWKFQSAPYFSLKLNEGKTNEATKLLYCTLYSILKQIILGSETVVLTVMFCGRLLILRNIWKMKTQRTVCSTYVRTLGMTLGSKTGRALRPSPDFDCDLKFSGNENQFYCGVVVVLVCALFCLSCSMFSVSSWLPTHSPLSHFIIFLLGNKGTKCAKQ